MKIVVLGAGAMGSIYGAWLSKKNDVYLYDIDRELADTINAKGITLNENGVDQTYKVRAVSSPEELPVADIMIVFVKALYTLEALTKCMKAIGEDTILMTLQNGMGHEEILVKFSQKKRVVIGTSQDNGTVLGAGYVRHKGEGITNIGYLVEKGKIAALQVEKVFRECGFCVTVYDQIQKLIWAKVLINTSLGSVTAALQSKMGIIAENKYAWELTVNLIKEAVDTANAEGMEFELESEEERIKSISIDNPEGVSSMSVDLKNGRKTEVEMICGAVALRAARAGIKTPYHECMINLIHGMEEKKWKL